VGDHQLRLGRRNLGRGRGQGLDGSGHDEPVLGAVLKRTSAGSPSPSGG
jgi:hypothetical protein